MTTLLAVVDDPVAAVAALEAVTRNPVIAVSHDGIGCIGTDGPDEPGGAGGPALSRQDGLIRALMGACTVLPFRFGTVAADASSLEPWLAERSAELRAALERVRGRVEMAVRAAVAEAEATISADPTGRQYLEALVRSRRPDRRLEDMHRAIAATADAACVTQLDSRRLVAAYLVGSDKWGSFRPLVASAAAASGVGAVCSVTGPWAPYSFTGGDQESLCGTGDLR